MLVKRSSLRLWKKDIEKIFKRSSLNTSLKRELNNSIMNFKLEKKDFFIPKEKRHSMILNINNLIYRLEPNDKELRILASIISSLSRK